MNPIETENQDGYFGCEGCRDYRCVEEQDLRVDADGVCWCDDCYTEDHTWEEWEALKPFAPKYRREIDRLRGALERCRAMRERGDATGGHACLHSALLLEVEKICEEAMNP